MDQLSPQEIRAATKAYALDKIDKGKNFLARGTAPLAIGVVAAVALSSEWVQKMKFINHNWWARGGAIIGIGYAALSKSSETTEDGVMYGRGAWALLGLGAFMLYRDHSNKKAFEDAKAADTKGPIDDTTETPYFTLQRHPQTQNYREMRFRNPATNMWARQFVNPQTGDHWLNPDTGAPKTQIWSETLNRWEDVSAPPKPREQHITEDDLYA